MRALLFGLPGSSVIQSLGGASVRGHRRLLSYLQLKKKKKKKKNPARLKAAAKLHLGE